LSFFPIRSGTTNIIGVILRPAPIINIYFRRHYWYWRGLGKIKPFHVSVAHGLAAIRGSGHTIKSRPTGTKLLTSL
jgi:hypothetical protein